MITIRPAQQSDLRKCKGLLRSSSYMEYPSGGYPDINFMKEYLNDTYFLVAESDKELAGLIFGEPLNVQGVALWFFIVHEKFRGKGIGNKLYSEFEKRLRKDKRKWIFLTSHIDNSIAANFYIKRGFIPGKPHFEMEKDL